MLPSIFGENLFDDFFTDPFGMMVMPQRHDPLYGKHSKNLMKTDVRETEDSYELDIDLPGFKKEDVSVELKNGKTEAFTLTVSDSAPTGENWAVEEYNTFSPSEPKFTLPLTRTSVRAVTVQNSGVTEALNAGSDYTISGQTLTLKKSALERYRKDGTAVVFSVDLADGTTYALVIDYVKRK